MSYDDDIKEVAKLVVQIDAEYDVSLKDILRDVAREYPRLAEQYLDRGEFNE